MSELEDAQGDEMPEPSHEMMLVTEDGETRTVEYQPCVWQHACGSQLFFLHDDGTCQCSRCNEFVQCLQWNKRP